VRKSMMLGMAATALLGCTGPAFAAAGPAGTVPGGEPAAQASAGIVGSASTASAITKALGARSAAARRATSYLGRLSAVQPEGSGSGSLSFNSGNAISCGSATACLSVGTSISLGSKTSAGFSPVAARWHAGTWQSVPVKTPKGGSLTVLGDVSCRAATYCMVAGEYATFAGSGSGIHPYMLTWNGSVLTPVAAPPVPKADELGILSGVSCVAVSSCVATGVGDVLANQNESVQFVWTWNGAKWTVATVRYSGSTFEMFTGLRCFTVSSCVAIGASFDLSSADGNDTPVVAHWNGTTFTDLKAPFPAGVSGGFTGLSCVSPHSCAVTGVGNASSTNPLPHLGIADVWNGKTWTVTKWRGPAGDTEAELRGVSCTSAVRCIAVGAHGTAKTGAPAALAWNGSKWTVLKVPGPSAGRAAVFDGVSCPVSGTCIATGETGKVGGSTESQLVGRWNGHAWKLGPM
jgi:hypothetical protein